MQHLQPNTTLQGGKYSIEQKTRYLKVYLDNPADCNIIKASIQMLKSVDKVNITNLRKGDLTIHHVSKKADTSMYNDVEQTLIYYYSFTIDDNIALQHTKRLVNQLDKKSQERILLESSIKSYNEFRFRHAFDDYRMCLELYMREILGNDKNLENQISLLREKMKERGFTVQLRNIIEKGIDYFCKFQNENVKHHNSISFVDTITIFTWGNTLLEQMILLNKMFNWNNS